MVLVSTWTHIHSQEMPNTYLKAQARVRVQWYPALLVLNTQQFLVLRVTHLSRT